MHRWFCCVCSPTEFTEFTEVRLHKSSHRFHGFAQMVGCVNSPTEFTEFTEVWLRKSSHRFHGFAQMAWLRKSSHGIHRIHRSLGVLLAAWVRQDAIPSYICVNPCYLLEPLLSQKVLYVPWVLWEYSLPRISQILTDDWLR